MAALSNSELEAVEAVLQQFRVNELHILLSSFKCPKLGKKSELVNRCLNLLQNARNQQAVIQKIREISTSRRYNSVIYGGSMDGTGSSSGMNGSVFHHPQPGLTLSAALMHQQYISAHAPFSSQMDRAKSLRIVDLPFYDKQMTLLDLSELPANISGIRSSSRLAFTFAIPVEVMPKIIYRNENTSLPRFELQLRFFLLDHSVEQHDEFPLNCSVKIDDVSVTLPSLIPTNKPNEEAKRPSRPVNITSYCQPPRDASRPHRITVEWTADKRAWAMGLYVVNRLNSDILLRRLLSNVNARRSVEDTRRIIQVRLLDQDDAVQMESLKISLSCPLGRKRMIVPVKAYDCAHLQCFDLKNYLVMNEKRPTWKCPVCNIVASYKKLIIDGYFEKMLKEISSDVADVELLRDGSWRPVVEDVQTLSDDEDLSSSGYSDSHPVNTKTASRKHPDDDVIVLDSDDDDEVPEIRQVLVRNNNAPKMPSPPPVICIDLDESDAVNLSPHTPQSSSSLSSYLPSSSTTSGSGNIIRPALTLSSAAVAATTGAAVTSGSRTHFGTTLPLLQNRHQQQYYLQRHHQQQQQQEQLYQQQQQHHHYQQQHQQQQLQQQQQHYQQQQQQQQSRASQSVQTVPPCFQNASIPLASTSALPAASTSSYLTQLDPFTFPYFQREFNPVISEELRQFMVNIQHSSPPPNFPGIS